MRKQGNQTLYTTCLCNCGSSSQCVFKVYIADGRITKVEPDDRCNKNAGREDEVITEEDLLKVRLQRRPCTRGLVFHKYLYQDERILYPLKRASGSQRGEGKYVRISWDEALNTIAEKMIEIREKYGPYSIMTPYAPNFLVERLFSHWGAGVDGWGWSSFDSARMMCHLIAGERGWNYPKYASGSAPDMLANAKLIVLWGLDSTMGNQGPGYQFAWFLKLARERGKKIIIFDPRYTPAAEVLANQWIPIKPGTDSAMFMALAYVLFKEDTWNKEFVAKYVEPKGFASWKELVLGLKDGIPKNPEWAAQQCGVPAETIRDLGLMLGKVKPAWLWCHWGVSRKSRGENTVRNFAALQAMLGYWGTPGAGPVFHSGPLRGIPFKAPLGPEGTYKVPKLYRSHKFAQAILELEQVKNGELSQEEYMRRVGWRANPEILKDFHPKMLFWGGHVPFGSNHLVTACESANYQIPAMLKMDFIVNMHNRLTPTVKYADIVLPALDYMWEERNITKTLYGGFEAINFCPGAVKPPGEVKPMMWVYTKIAQKLGIEPQKFFSYYTTDENWDQDWERYLKDGYQLTIDYYRKRNIKVPSWEEFTAGKFINCDELEDKPYTGFEDQMVEGKPFRTESGKIELFSNYIANEKNKAKGEHYDKIGQIYDNLPADWGDLTPAPAWLRAEKGIQDEKYPEYPLTLLSPPGRYRVHSIFWDHPWLRNQVYRHRVWINVADAQARKIKDDDLVLVYNDRGKLVMPAYVTSRIMPGIVVVRHGGNYQPDENGVDFGATPATLLGGDNVSCVTPASASTRVQVEKYQTC
jgi:anaerobic dimethyl sulfoxide reductase subunit A